MYTDNQWSQWKSRGGSTVILGFGPLLVVVGPLLTVLDPCAPVGGTKLTSLSGNQAFTVSPQSQSAMQLSTDLASYR